MGCSLVGEFSPIERKPYIEACLWMWFIRKLLCNLVSGSGCYHLWIFDTSGLSLRVGDCYALGGAENCVDEGRCPCFLDAC